MSVWQAPDEDVRPRAISISKKRTISEHQIPHIEEREDSSPPRSVAQSGYNVLLRNNSSFMSTSSSEDMQDSDLPFALEMGSLSLNSVNSPPVPRYPSDALAMSALQQGVGQPTFISFLHRYTCFDLVPDSGKIVVMDVGLSLVDCFAALREHGIRGAPLWDTESNRFVGMVTHSDFVLFLHSCITAIERNAVGMEESRKEREALQRLKKSVRYWRRECNSTHRKLVSVGPDQTLFEAVETLLRFNLHRIAVYDEEDESLLFLLSHRVILKYLLVGVGNADPSFQKSVRELGLGRRLVGVGVAPDTPFFDVLHEFAGVQENSLPVLDEHQKVISIVSKNDIKAVVLPGFWGTLSASVSDVLKARHGGLPDPSPWLIRLDDTLWDVCQKLTQWRLQRLYLVSNDGCVLGDLRINELFLWMRYSSRSEQANGGMDWEKQ